MKINNNQETISISAETIAKINQLEPDTLLAHGIIQLVPGKTDEFICPICNNGGSGNHDATGIKPKIYFDHVGWKCHRCGEKFDNIAIFAAHFGLSDKTDFVALCQKICANFNLPLTADVPFTPEKKSDVNPAELNFINQDLTISTDALKAFLDAQNGAWRGLPLETLLRFGCRYIDAWTPPKARANQTYSTPTPRIIIPANYDGLHSNYLARLTAPAQKFEKIHAGKKTLFNVDALNSAEEEPVFAVEGYVDAMSLEFVGFRAVATGGADSFNLLVNAVKPLKKKPDVIILFDPDDTGRKTAPKLKSALVDVGCRAVIKFLSADVSKTDANSILQEQGADFLMNDIFAIEQEAIKDFETRCDETPSVDTKAENSAQELITTREEKESATGILSFDDDFNGEDYMKETVLDLDNAARLEKFRGKYIRWLTDDEQWILCQNGIWHRHSDKNSCLYPVATAFANKMLVFAKECAQFLATLTPPTVIHAKWEDKTPEEKQYEIAEAKADKAFKVAYCMKKRASQSAAIDLLKGCSSILIEAKDLNKNKHLIACQNGVINLKTGELLPLDTEHLITNQLGAIFNPHADTSFVEKFLADILPDANTRRAVLRYIGYCLTGEKTYHISEFWKGGGANGKSTLIELILAVFGSYAKKMTPSLILENQKPVDGNSATPAIAQLDGDIRLAIVDELPRKARIDSALFKTLVGDRFVYSRALYCNPRTIELRAKFVINGNHLPSFDVDDYGMERRINNIPFTQSFKGDRADSELPNKLSTPENLSAFLKLIVAEAVNFYRDGLLESDQMKEAKEEYFAENDFVRNFLVDNCITGQGGEITRKALEEKITAAYPRECARLKKKELLDQIICRLEPHDVIYTKRRDNKNIFKNIKWLDSDD